jgi:hypothetical protein
MAVPYTGCWTWCGAHQREGPSLTGSEIICLLLHEGLVRHGLQVDACEVPGVQMKTSHCFNMQTRQVRNTVFVSPRMYNGIVHTFTIWVCKCLARREVSRIAFSMMYLQPERACKSWHGAPADVLAKALACKSKAFSPSATLIFLRHFTTTSHRDAPNSRITSAH